MAFRNCIFLLLTIGAVALAQEPAAPVNPWLDRAQLLTDDLLSDTKALNTYDRAAFWGRLADAWWNDDPKRARTWLMNGVKLVENSPTGDKLDQACRLVAARALLSVAASRAPELSDRLTAILAKHLDRDDDRQNSQNATALVDAGLATVATNPAEAGKLGAKSLDFGFSFRLSNLLWRLRKQDKVAGDALFRHMLDVANSRREVNLVSMLLYATVQGPFTTSEYQQTVLEVLAERIHSIPKLQRDPYLCSLASLATPHVAQFDKLFPEKSQRIREAIEVCTLSSSTGSANATQSTDEETTVEYYLKQAERAESEEQKELNLTRAADWAAWKKKDFEKAIEILDSISLDGRKRLGETWETRRWNHAASAACDYVEKDDLPAMTRTIENTPKALRPYVQLTLASECLPPASPINPIELLGPARNELENASGDKKVSWYLSMVRLYEKYSPSAAPAVLTEAVTAINRTNEEKPDDCDPAKPGGNVFANSLFANSYKIPATLLERDGAGVRYALGSVRAVDKRAMLRLQLLKDVLVQKAAYRKPVSKKPNPQSTPPEM